MGAYFFHKAALDKTLEYLELPKKYPVSYPLLADKKLGSHGWNVPQNIDYTWDKIQFCCTEKDVILKASLISHLFLDCFTIGQISDEFWGKIDNRIDFFSETVSNKTMLCYELPMETLTVSNLKVIYEQKVRWTYLTFKNHAPKYSFLFSNMLSLMVRLAVKNASFLTHNLISLTS
jgi:hypothetical protein